jgi:NAD(P)-dependent dehydrogenase (short-subunit alcohol dehydrogenase family)
MTPPDSLSCLVTGAGGDIGRAITARLLAGGHRVAALDISVPALARLAAAHPEQPRLLTAHADIRDLASIRAALEAAEAALGPPDVLINNAGGVTAPTLSATSEADWLADIELNLNGPFRCIHAVAEGFVARGRGTILNVASVNGLGVFGHPGYSVAKAGLIHLTRFCATEYGRHGIRSVALCPGTVRTQAWEARRAAQPDILDAALAWYPSRDISTPDDVAAAIEALLNPSLRLMNGAVITLDGGLTAGSDLLASAFTGTPL